VTSDDQYGTMTVAAWSGLHPKQQRHPGYGTGGPIVRGTVIRVQVDRVPARPRPPKVLWLWWAGPGELDLDLAWRAYVRRFDLEHTVRFAKQTLGGPRRGHAIPSRRSGGPGWCWPATPSCVWPASWWPTSGWRGSDPTYPVSCRPTGSAGGFRACCVWWGRRPVRRNPPALPRPAQGPPIWPCSAPPAGNKPAAKPTKKALKKPTKVATAA
jgi:hypothetical protein